MKRNSFSREELDEVIAIINSQGYENAKSFLLSTYGINYQIFKDKVRKDGRYKYNRAQKQYQLISHSEDPFMSLEELSCKRRDSPSNVVSFKPQNSFEILMNELIQERLLEYHKFITFSREDKCISINLSYLDEQGFTLKTC